MTHDRKDNMKPTLSKSSIVQEGPKVGHSPAPPCSRIVDDVYWSQHWGTWYARWNDGQVEPLRDSGEAERVARKWDIQFTANSV